MCLTKDQATQIYEEVEKNELINIQIDSKDNSKVRKRQAKEEDIDTNVNPYQKAISNADFRDENKIEQMINWSIFTDKIRYIHSCTNVNTKFNHKTIRRKET